MVMKECDSVVATSFQTNSGKFFCLTRPKSISTASESSPPKENPQNRNEVETSQGDNPEALETSPGNVKSEVRSSEGDDLRNCLSPSETVSAEKDLEEDKKVVEFLVIFC